jgi:hypothetical protein
VPLGWHLVCARSGLRRRVTHQSAPSETSGEEAQLGVQRPQLPAAREGRDRQGDRGVPASPTRPVRRSRRRPSPGRTARS